MRVFIYLSFLTLGLQVQAGVPETYYSISSVQTVAVPTSDQQKSHGLSVLVANPPAPSPVPDSEQACDQQIQPRVLDLSLGDLDQIVSIGKTIWTLIAQNKPVVNAQSGEIAVLPEKLACWRWLSGWQNPVVQSFQTTMKNGFGMTVVDFTYQVLSIAGGNYQGKGKYLARVALVPEQLSVSWGYEFNASVKVPTVLNYGTMVDPVAAAQIQLTYSVDTILKHFESTDNYLVKGNGEILSL